MTPRALLRRLVPADGDKLGSFVLVLVTAVVGVVSIRSVLAETGGLPAVPLDDTYIHFQYARSFAELSPFVYSPGSARAPGATSLLWPISLSPFWAVGLRGTSLIWAAWALGWLSLAGTALETRRLAQGLVSPGVAFAAGGMVLSFGGLVWSAGSGMEIVPLSFLLVRTARRASEWREATAPPSRFAHIELCALGVLAPCMRPEGLIASATAAAALLTMRHGRARGWAAVPLVGPLLPPLLNWALTGSSTSTTALVKWLPASPYLDGSRLFDNIWKNVQLLFGTLLDGQVWSAIFVPSGGKVLAWCALPALCALGIARNRPWRATATLVIALGMLIPTTYDSFLWNRLRYLWPFAPAWFVALAAVSEGLARLAGRRFPELTALRLGIAGALVGLFASRLSWSIDDLAKSSDAIRRQQVALGLWARDELPASAVIGVNDTGAIAYFSERKVFDVVGLTTRGEARYWVAGPGSRFEHYERMPREALPTHFIVYPAWFAEPALLGEYLTERSVPGATILGGTTMVAHVASWEVLGSGARPLEHAPNRPSIDELDTADLESESAHDFALGWATQEQNRAFEGVVGGSLRVDGGRGERTRDAFSLEVAPGGLLVMRGSVGEPMTLALSIDGRAVKPLSLDGPFAEAAVTLPVDIRGGRRRLVVSAPEGRRFASLHYWSFAPESPREEPEGP